MAKEKVLIDFTVGRKVFDTSKMDEWTSEEWREWVGDPEDHLGFKVVLYKNSDFYLKMSRLYYNEATKDLHLDFETLNKFGRDISIQFKKWIVDDQEFDLSDSTPLVLKKDSEIKYFKESVNYMFIQSALYMELSIMDLDNKEIIREFEFTLKLYNN